MTEAERLERDRAEQARLDLVALLLDHFDVIEEHRGHPNPHECAILVLAKIADRTKP